MRAADGNDPFLSHSAAQSRPTLPIDARPGGEQAAVRSNPFATRAPEAADVRANPFATRAAEAGSAEPADVDLRSDPFLTHAARRTTTNVAQDPFLTHGRASSNRRWDRQQAQARAVQAMRHWSEALKALLGPGDPNRRSANRNVLILLPWVVFVFMVLTWCSIRHYSSDLATIITLFVFGACTVMLFRWSSGAGKAVPNLLPLSVLCLLAVAAGTACGLYGWNHQWRQWWWFSTGGVYDETSAATPALAREDASVISFIRPGSSSSSASGWNYTSVAVSMSAGFVHDHVYCVAPVLNADMASGALITVNYWAIGVDCCSQGGGSFTCDDSMDATAQTGVVMLRGGYPCPSCNNDLFALAVSKAEALHGLVSSNEALLVRWVSNATSLEDTYLEKALLYVLVVAIIALLFFFVAGGLCWYYGGGEPSPSSAEDGVKLRSVV